ncbi:TIGR03086 family metal-binding protein [Kitasatospora sp. CM 4170]|uniref:TIGR03086 family metal-binding protein n=1 Tax=Kitasatospora aburaviensis TaxID=67265 RepID=A0ABW1F402_9ACTN|nr:TIGR03086 family metal-binding protein [Kitasatospora sp. CM 4170]WNM47229.1 TIGR03086 family metal-binding protein [Kitasatospora sp. CM 4170]
MNGHALHPLLARAAAEAARVARGVRRERLDGPTPCPGFDTRTLVNHWVLYTSHGLEHRARRTELPPELVERDFTADPGWAGDFARQLDRAVAAWADPAAWEGEVDLGGAPVPAVDIARMLLAELLLHGWDVARATGQGVEVGDDLAELLLGVVEDLAELYRQYDGFAAPVPVPVGAPVFERALGASGRDPRWAPAAVPTAPTAPAASA